MGKQVTDSIDMPRSFQWRRPLGWKAVDHRGAFGKLGSWRKRRQTIRDLEALDDRLLADIGINRDQIRLLVDDLIDTGAAEPSAANDNRAAVAA